MWCDHWLSKVIHIFLYIKSHHSLTRSPLLINYAQTHIALPIHQNSTGILSSVTILHIRGIEVGSAIATASIYVMLKTRHFLAPNPYSHHTSSCIICMDLFIIYLYKGNAIKPIFHQYFFIIQTSSVESNIIKIRHEIYIVCLHQ